MIVSSDKMRQKTDLSREIIVETLSDFYDQEEIGSLLKTVLEELELKPSQNYSFENFVKICRKLKEFGGNACFCGSILIIKALTSRISKRSRKQVDEV
ncbi:MAG TPA: hypothetical protein VIH20_04430 [Candidatus Subteraquimicrobiales bacterium]